MPGIHWTEEKGEESNVKIHYMLVAADDRQLFPVSRLCFIINFIIIIIEQTYWVQPCWAGRVGRKQQEQNEQIKQMPVVRGVFVVIKQDVKFLF